MASGAAEIARHIVVRGRVQGVWYRAWTVQTAGGLGLRGWVRNRADGSVEALLAGAPDAVARMIEACRRGPELAKVAALEIDEADPAALGGGGDGFRQLPTV
jgi:acylphosphatase